MSCLLSRVAKLHRQQTNCLLGKIGLHAGQERLLMELWKHEGLAQSALAEKLCIQPPTLARMLDRMEKQNLVVRKSDNKDHRVTCVFLLPRGREIRSEVEMHWKALEKQVIAQLSGPEVQVLRTLLERVLNNLQSPEMHVTCWNSDEIS